MQHRRFRTGDQVRVRSAQEILATLDADGTLEGLPFMPEMLHWCGRVFRVQRCVEKTCVSGHPMRRFPANDVVILDGPRCEGDAHDGCNHACRIFWKEAWLSAADAPASTAQESPLARARLRARLKVKADEHRYFCQSTELYKATEDFPGTRRAWALRILFREIANGDLGAGAALRLSARYYWQRLRRSWGADQWLRGTCKRTPSASLALQPGDVVRVKDCAQIGQTLDIGGRNRGMGICDEMRRCCGGQAEVRFRVERIVDECTGRMQQLGDTVTLENVRGHKSLAEECLCYGQLGDCPRGELMYWREIWLERVHPAANESRGIRRLVLRKLAACLQRTSVTGADS